MEASRVTPKERVSAAKLGAIQKESTHSDPLMNLTREEQKLCASPESNRGPIDGNDGFYR